MNIISIFFFVVGFLILLTRTKIVYQNHLKYFVLFLFTINRHNIYINILFIILFLISMGWKPKYIISSGFQILGISKDNIFNIIENICNDNGYIIEKKSLNDKIVILKNGILINVFLGFTIFDNTYLAINSKKRKSKEYEDFLNLIYTYVYKLDLKPYKTGVFFIIISIVTIFVHYYIINIH